MNYLLYGFLLSFLLISLTCSTGPTESLDGKYGREITDKSNVLTIDHIFSRQGQYLDRDIIVYGTIIEIDSFQGTWFDISSGDDIIRCTIKDFKLPQSLEGSNVWVWGELKLIQVASEGGRDIGGSQTFAADPSSSRYEDQLRIQTKGVQVDPDGQSH